MASQMYRYKNRQAGSQLPAFALTLKDGGSAVDLTAGSLAFRMTAEDGTVEVATVAATSATSAGQGTYLPDASVVTAGEHLIQWRWTNGSGSIFWTPPIGVTVKANA